jgi:hypothetical protein
VKTSKNLVLIKRPAPSRSPEIVGKPRNSVQSWNYVETCTEQDGRFRKNQRPAPKIGDLHRNTRPALSRSSGSVKIGDLHRPARQVQTCSSRFDKISENRRPARQVQTCSSRFSKTSENQRLAPTCTAGSAEYWRFFYV